MPINKRQEALRKKLAKHKLDALLVSSLDNIRYLTGFSGSSGLVLFSQKEITLFTDGRYTLQAKEEVKNTKVNITSKYLENLSNYLKSNKLKRLGIEAQHMTVDIHNKLQKLLPDNTNLIITYNLTEELRVIKDLKEVNYIKQATKIAYSAFAYIEKEIQPGISEKEIANKLEWAIKSKGSEKIPFEIIVASGWRSALPHATPSDKLLAEGEFVVIDFGATLNGYNADLTRTLILGAPSPEQKKLYQLVNEAQTKGIKAIQAGVEAAQIDQITRQVIEDAGYGKYFVHSTGHGLGLQIHEWPRISSEEKTILKEGMVFTIEPGIYIPNIGGIRIEDMVLVTSNGCQIISKEF